MRMQGTSNEGANAILEEEPVSPVQDLLNLSREPNVSKLVDNVEGNVNGGGDKVVTKLRNGSPIPGFNHFPGFPHLVLPRKPSYANQTYARSLFASGHGYALFTPATVSEVPDDFTATRGISMGDVGILSEDSEFVFAFNIFLPADHPYNKNTPDSFHPLDPLEEAEVCTSVDYFPRGTVIASRGVKVTRHSEDPLHLTFRSSEPQGSFLILPEGATRQNISTTRVLEYVAHNAVKWASFFANVGSYSAANGATYVVTGVDKTSACSMLTFPSVPTRKPNMSALYRNGELLSVGNMCLNNQGKKGTSTSVFNNLCVFMRGIRIGLGRFEWIENVDEKPEYMTPYTEVSVPRPQRPLIIPNFCLKARYTESLVGKPAFSTHPFHLSDTVAQVMLSMNPDASVILVDDSIWAIFSKEIFDRRTNDGLDLLTINGLRGSSLDDFGMMLDEIFGLHDIVESQGVLKLVRNSKERMTKDTWFMKLWLWLTGRRSLHPGDALEELLRQGQLHVETNNWGRSTTPISED